MKESEKGQNKWEEYYRTVLEDFRELKEFYPYAYLSILPTTKPSLAAIRVIAADYLLVNAVFGKEEDFLGEYSKELHITIPLDYQKTGCKVYGAKWVDVNRLKDKDIHFYNKTKQEPYGYELCVGTPESFLLMRNVILENVRTADNMLVAYERMMTGVSDRLELIAYAHGDSGRKQFVNSKVKYIPKRRRHGKIE